jgi:hypothetical protein
LGELNLVMRQLSPTVCVLKGILRPFRRFFHQKCSGLLKFAKDKRISALRTTDDEAKIEWLKAKLKGGIRRLLDPSDFPVALSVVCYRVTEIIKNAGPKVQPDENLASWTLASMMFLRFLVPIFTSYKGNETKRRAMMLVGKILMKLCCKTRLSGDEKILNDVLEESFPVYDRFCDVVVRKGKKIYHGEMREQFKKERQRTPEQLTTKARANSSSGTPRMARMRSRSVDNLGQPFTAGSVLETETLKTSDVLSQMKATNVGYVSPLEKSDVPSQIKSVGDGYVSPFEISLADEQGNSLVKSLDGVSYVSPFEIRQADDQDNSLMKSLDEDLESEVSPTWKEDVSKLSKYLQTEETQDIEQTKELLFAFVAKLNC